MDANTIHDQLRALRPERCWLTIDIRRTKTSGYFGPVTWKEALRIIRVAETVNENLADKLNYQYVIW